MATKKKAEMKEVKDAPAVKASGGGGGGGGSDPFLIDRAVIKGKACTAFITLDMNTGKVEGYVEFDGHTDEFSAQLGG